jgi:ATP-independent RNA helicase DbpA
MTEQTAFQSLPLREELLSAMRVIGFSTMTSVQQRAIPIALSGKDVIAKASTGSGKTLAFGLPILQQLDATQRAPSSIVLCPTRELAEQVAEQLRDAAKHLANTKILTLCGGVPMPPQIASLSHGANIIVGTPGRILDHLSKRRLDLSRVTHLVLDEADRMLDMGFEDALAAVLQSVPDSAQCLLFSATFPPEVESIVNGLAPTAERVDVTEAEVLPDIQQLIYRVDNKLRVETLKAVITEYQPPRCIVFCATKDETQRVTDELQASGFSAVCLHGDLEQRERTEMLAMFSADCAIVLIATDVAARGLDIEDVPLVVNFRVSEDVSTHVHRIGRTGRAGKAGLAVSLMAAQDEIFVARIEEHFNQSIPSKGAQSLRFHANRIVPPAFNMVIIKGGKKEKLRPGDILGALTQDAQVPNEDIGKIKITATTSYVAIKQRSIKRTLAFFRDGKIKGKRLRARKIAIV